MSGSVWQQDLAGSDEETGRGKRRACWVLTACEEELVAVHAHRVEGEAARRRTGRCL